MTVHSLNGGVCPPSAPSRPPHGRPKSFPALFPTMAQTPAPAHPHALDWPQWTDSFRLKLGPKPPKGTKRGC